MPGDEHLGVGQELPKKDMEFFYTYVDEHRIDQVLCFIMSSPSKLSMIFPECKYCLYKRNDGFVDLRNRNRLMIMTTLSCREAKREILTTEGHCGRFKENTNLFDLYSIRLQELSHEQKELTEILTKEELSSIFNKKIKQLVNLFSTQPQEFSLTEKQLTALLTKEGFFSSWNYKNKHLVDLVLALLPLYTRVHPLTLTQKQRREMKKKQVIQTHTDKVTQLNLILCIGTKFSVNKKRIRKPSVLSSNRIYKFKNVILFPLNARNSWGHRKFGKDNVANENAVRRTPRNNFGRKKVLCKDFRRMKMRFKKVVNKKRANKQLLIRKSESSGVEDHPAHDDVDLKGNAVYDEGPRLGLSAHDDVDLMCKAVFDGELNRDLSAQDDVDLMCKAVFDEGLSRSLSAHVDVDLMCKAVFDGELNRDLSAQDDVDLKFKSVYDGGPSQTDIQIHLSAHDDVEPKSKAVCYERPRWDFSALDDIDLRGTDAWDGDPSRNLSAQDDVAPKCKAVYDEGPSRDLSAQDDVAPKCKAVYDEGPSWDLSAQDDVAPKCKAVCYEGPSRNLSAQDDVAPKCKAVYDEGPSRDLSAQDDVAPTCKAVYDEGPSWDFLAVHFYNRRNYCGFCDYDDYPAFRCSPACWSLRSLCFYQTAVNKSMSDDESITDVSTQDCSVVKSRAVCDDGSIRDLSTIKFRTVCDYGSIRDLSTIKSRAVCDDGSIRDPSTQDGSDIKSTAVCDEVSIRDVSTQDGSVIKSTAVCDEVSIRDVLTQDGSVVKSTAVCDDGSIRDLSTIKSTAVCDDGSIRDKSTIKSTAVCDDGSIRDKSTIKSRAVCDDGSIRDLSTIKSRAVCDDGSIRDLSTIKSRAVCDDGSIRDLSTQDGSVVKSTAVCDDGSIRDTSTIKSRAVCDDGSIRDPSTQDGSVIKSTAVCDDGSIRDLSTPDYKVAVWDNDLKKNIKLKKYFSHKNDSDELFKKNILYHWKNADLAKSILEKPIFSWDLPEFGLKSHFNEHFWQEIVVCPFTGRPSERNTYNPDRTTRNRGRNTRNPDRNARNPERNARIPERSTRNLEITTSNPEVNPPQGDPNNFMNYEVFRLSSFNYTRFPANVDVWVTQLAQAGFYYVDENRKIVCFDCGQEFHGGANAPIENVHGPECHHLQTSQPLQMWTQGLNRELLAIYYNRYGSLRPYSLQVSDAAGMILGRTDVSQAGSGLPILGQQDNENASVAPSMGRGTNHPREAMPDGEVSTFGESVGPEYHSETVASARNETSRDYPFGNQRHSLPTDLNVVSGVLVSEESEDMSVSHNILTSAARNPVSVHTNSNRGDQAQVAQSGSENGAIGGSDTALDLSKSSYPLFSSATARRQTFTTWSSTHSHQPDDLVAAGFFYAGYADCVRCFYCGLGLKFWRETDIPAYQHARYRPHCVYNRLYKGQDYIERVQQDIQAEQQGASNQGSNQDSMQPAPQGETAAAPAPVEPDLSAVVRVTPETVGPQIHLLMDSTVAQTAMLNGWQRYQVQRAVEHIIRELGENCLEIGILIDVLMNLYSNHEENSFPSGNSSGSSDSGITETPMSPIHLASVRNPAAQISDVADAVREPEAADPPSVQNPITGAIVREHGCSRVEIFQTVEREHELLTERTTCRLCQSRPVCCVFLPCGHVISCQQCAETATHCLFCRQRIMGTASVFLS